MDVRSPFIMTENVNRSFVSFGTKLVVSSEKSIVRSDKLLVEKTEGYPAYSIEFDEEISDAVISKSSAQRENRADREEGFFIPRDVLEKFAKSIKRGEPIRGEATKNITSEEDSVTHDTVINRQSMMDVPIGTIGIIQLCVFSGLLILSIIFRVPFVHPLVSIIFIISGASFIIMAEVHKRQLSQ